MDAVLSRQVEILYVGLGSIPGRRAGNIVPVHEVGHQLFLAWCWSEKLAGPPMTAMNFVWWSISRDMSTR